MTDFMTDQYMENDYVNPNIAWVQEMVDKSKWLPVKSMHDWCYTIWSDNDFPTFSVTLQDGTIVEVHDIHPQPEMHLQFVKEIVLPFIKEQFTDYSCPEFKEHHYGSN